MKPLSFSLISALLLSVSLFSCVGKKKYLAEVQERESLQATAKKLRVDQRVLQSQYDALETKSANQQAELASLSQAKTKLEGELGQLKTEKANLQQELAQVTNKALSQSQQMDAALQSKIAELNRKQALIDELQGAIAQRDAAMQNLLSKIEGAIAQYSADELSVELRDGKVYVAMSDKLLFQSGSAYVNKDGKEALGKLAGVLQRDSTIKIMVEGHTDNVPLRSGGAYKDNWDLSVIRATSVLRILTKDYDINPKQITASGKGDTTPKATNESPEGRALNRRTEIIIEPRLDEIYQVIKARE
ncbi:MAG: OmpA family protein [Bacteroidota bacterium]